MSEHDEKPDDLPRELEIECAVLGSLIVDNAGVDVVAPVLDALHFSEPLHQRIYSTLVAQVQKQVATPLTIHAAMRSDAALGEMGGISYLVRLVQAAPALPNLRAYATILRRSACQREMILVGEETASAGRSMAAGDDIESLVDRCSDRLRRIATAAAVRDTLRPFSECAQEAVDLAEAASRQPDQAFVSWGLRAVDDAIGPLFRTDLIVLGAATSIGKTSLVQHVFLNAGRAGRPALFCSLEMPGAQLAMRTQAQSIRVSSDRIRRGALSSQEFEALVLGSQNFADLPLYVDDRSRMTVAQIRAKAQTIKRKHGDLALLVVDHLQYIAPADPRADRHEQLRQETEDLKVIARDLNTAVLLISHITKENERRDDKRPVMADLFGSSGIQQNADRVVFVHRDFYYLSRTKVEAPGPGDKRAEEAYNKWLLAREAADGWAEIFSDKNRLGKIGSARVRFNEQFTEFSDPDAPVSAQAGLDYSNLAQDLKG